MVTSGHACVHTSTRVSPWLQCIPVKTHFWPGFNKINGSLSNFLFIIAWYYNNTSFVIVGRLIVRPPDDGPDNSSLAHNTLIIMGPKLCKQSKPKRFPLGLSGMARPVRIRYTGSARYRARAEHAIEEPYTLAARYHGRLDWAKSPFRTCAHRAYFLWHRVAFFVQRMRLEKSSLLW